MILFVIIVIFLFSFGLALISLRKVTKIGEIEEISKELKRGRVVFQKESLPSD
jgi:hypothetical protein